MPAHQATHNADQIAAHRAADAAIVHFKDIFIVIADFAELILYHDHAQAMLPAENVVKQVVLSEPKKSVRTVTRMRSYGFMVYLG